MTGPPAVSLRDALDGPSLEVAGALFGEYHDTLSVPSRYGVQWARIAGDLRAGLEPGAMAARYLPPAGAAVVARVGGHPVGAVGVRMVGDDLAELKHLYVRPDHRGAGLGRALTEAAVDRARSLGASRVRLESMPEMTAALAIYRAAGFVPTAPYGEVDDAVYLELRYGRRP